MTFLRGRLGLRASKEAREIVGWKTWNSIEVDGRCKSGSADLFKFAYSTLLGWQLTHDYLFDSATRDAI